MGQQDAVAAQNQSNADWEAQQSAAAAKANQQDQANRQQQMAALNTAEQKLTPQAMQDAQQTAQNTLNTQMLSGSPAAPNANVQMLSGQTGAGADTSVTSDMASRVTDAARQAQGRIAALAGINSYGSGYQGAQAGASQALNTSGEAINMYGDFRKGDTSTLGVTQQIQPIQYTQGSNIAGSLAGSLGQIAGKGLGSSLAASMKGT